jgi:hypothetical protein
MVLSPLRDFWTNYAVFASAEEVQPELTASGSWHAYKQWIWIVWGLTAAASIAGGYCLWRVRRPSSPMLATAALWIAGPGALIGSLLVGVRIYGQATNTKPEYAFAGLAVSAAFAVVWSIYLRRSKRVRLTYGTSQPAVREVPG